MTVANAPKQPGHVHGDDGVNVTPDGRCGASVILAAFSPSLCSDTSRAPDGFMTSLDDVRREEKEAKKWLAAVAQRHGKLKYVPRLLELASGACAETRDFPVLATAMHHRIVVEPAVQDHPLMIFREEAWPTGVWMKQQLRRGSEHFKSAESWQPPIASKNPTRPSSSSDQSRVSSMNLRNLSRWQASQ